MTRIEQVVDELDNAWADYMCMRRTHEKAERTVTASITAILGKLSMLAAIKGTEQQS